MSAQVTSSTFNPVVPGRQAKTVESAKFSWQDLTQRRAWIAVVASAVALVWAYWMMLVDAAAEWDQPQYSHGWILPVIALFMMWRLRPNKQHNPQLDTALKAVAGVGVALLAAGNSIESLAFLQGIGLAVGCLGFFACIMWGQPFATFEPDAGPDARYSYPEAIWGITAAGILFTSIGLSGVQLGPLAPDISSMLGLVILILGFVLAAAFAQPPRVVSWHEIGAGTAAILLCTAAWMSAIYYDRMPLAQASFVATAIAILCVVGGMRLVRWAGPPVAFLLFMFPLPTLIERSTLGMLQKIAVVLSEAVYTLIGVPAIREGNMLNLPGDIPMEIAEACSGLSMTNILVAMCVALVILMDRPWWDRLIVLLSALPIAIISNVFRIVLTGLIWMAMDNLLSFDPEYMSQLRDPIHSWIGLIVMMPFALGLMLLELKILTMLSQPDTDSLERSQVLSRGGGAPIS